MAKPSLLVMALASAAGLVSCNAGAVERHALCERSSALDTAVARTGELSKGAKDQNAAVLRNQIDEDLTNLVAALDVAPRSVASDISTVAERLRNLYGALELVDWDSSRFVSDDSLARVVEELASVNTRRHLARITDYLLKSCNDGGTDALPPPDSVVQLPATSTSVAVVGEDPIPADQNLLTAHVAMGSAIAESVGAKITVGEAECLGSEADAVALTSDQISAGGYDKLFASIFSKCGVTVPDQPGS